MFLQELQTDTANCLHRALGQFFLFEVQRSFSDALGKREASGGVIQPNELNE